MCAAAAAQAGAAAAADCRIFGLSSCVCVSVSLLASTLQWYRRGTCCMLTLRTLPHHQAALRQLLLWTQWAVMLRCQTLCTASFEHFCLTGLHLGAAMSWSGGLLRLVCFLLQQCTNTTPQGVGTKRRTPHTHVGYGGVVVVVCGGL